MRKWLNTELDSFTESVAMHNFLKEAGIEYKASHCDNFVHFEVYVNREEQKEVDAFIDRMQILNKYLNKHLNDYVLSQVTRLSSHPDGDYLYIVKALNTKALKYAVWTSWNTTTHSLNYGHYDLTDEQAESVIKEFKH